MTKKQKYLNSEAHGYLLESDACALLIKELERALHQVSAPHRQGKCRTAG